MNEKLKEMSELEIVESLLKESNEPINIHQLIKSVHEIKGIRLDDVDKLTQLYMDITLSVKFVYCGDDKWDLKERHLEIWDKAGFENVYLEEFENQHEEVVDLFSDSFDEDENEYIDEDENDFDMISDTMQEKYNKDNKTVIEKFVRSESDGTNSVDFEYVNCNQNEMEILRNVVIEAAENIDFDDTVFYFTEECERLVYEIDEIILYRNLSFNSEIVYWDENYETVIKKIKLTKIKF